MEVLGIVSAPVIGHSMGGTVSLRVALEHPERVSRVGIVGSPIHGVSLNPLLKLAGVPWIAHTLWRIPAMLRIVMWTVLAGDSKGVREMIFRDVNKASTESFFRSIGDLHHTDLRSSVSTIEMPAIGLFGVRDNIVSPKQSKLMRSLIPAARVEMLEHSRHFPMLDEPDIFNDHLIRFLQDSGERTVSG
jgi:pimeloyl-ACP methyl ester carboxylesterase